MTAFFACLLVAAAHLEAVPVDQTRYGRACLRIESRPKPCDIKEPEALWRRERELAEAGVEARWIQMVDNWGSPLIENPYLPCRFEKAAEHEVFLKQWVAKIHEAGLPAVSWYPLSFCQAGFQRHEEWRQVSLLPWPPGNAKDICCCFNSEYGDRLIKYCCYALERLDLDGIWFDGSAWTPIWERPLPLTCACQSCKAKFREETKLELPQELDWDDPTFRRWLAWRFEQFGGFIGRLAKGIRDAHPDAAVVINHYHRPNVPWHSAIPLDRYDADIISGSEAFSPDQLDLTMRLCRAYGRGQAEVWRPFTTGRGPDANAEPLLQHALISYAAGGHPSFGGFLLEDEFAPTAALMSPIMKAIHPSVGGRSLPLAALHVSQQSETFYFGPVTARPGLIDPYFQSLSAWSAGLGEAHLPMDYVYDADLTAANLSRYPVALMPLSLALTDEQAAAAIEYARRGGTLLLGVGAGQLDGQAQILTTNPLGEALGFQFDGVPQADGSGSPTLALRPSQPGQAVSVSGRHAALRLQSDDWHVDYRTADSQGAQPVVASRQFGEGRVTVVSVDPVRTFGSTPAFGGKTKLQVTDDTAATGTYSLKYVDDPISPQTFYPDLENKVVPFEAPDFLGGELSLDLRVDQASHASIEIRSTVPPIHGPIVAITSGGKVQTAGQTVCQVPLNEWFHLAIAYTFASGDAPSTYEVTVTLPDGTTHAAKAQSHDKDYCRTDWFVIFGAGTANTTFHLDNLKLSRMTSDTTKQIVHSLDFEEGPDAFSAPTTLVRELVQLLTESATLPLEVEAPEHVRVGVFEADENRLLVHLHNRNGLRREWQQPNGPSATIRCRFPVASARLAVSGTALGVADDADRARIGVPSVGLYEVVEIAR